MNTIIITLSFIFYVYMRRLSGLVFGFNELTVCWHVSFWFKSGRLSFPFLPSDPQSASQNPRVSWCWIIHNNKLVCLTHLLLEIWQNTPVSIFFQVLHLKQPWRFWTKVVNFWSIKLLMPFVTIISLCFNRSSSSHKVSHSELTSSGIWLIMSLLKI